MTSASNDQVVTAPTNERQALERERDELPAHVVAYQRELDATPPESKNVGSGSNGRFGGYRREWRRFMQG